MALSGLNIYKHLPKTNCKDCGFPTCLAFAMKVAAGQKPLDECPHLSDEGKAALGEASAPPQELVTIGVGDGAVKIGRETVLFRHEERFHNQTAIAVRVNDDLGDAEIEKLCGEINAMQFERMGATLQVDMVAVNNASGNADTFLAAAQKIKGLCSRPLALISSDPECLKKAGQELASDRPLLWATDGGAKQDAVIAVAKELSLPVCLEAGGFDEIVSFSEAARTAGLKEYMISPGNVDIGVGLEFLTQSRRAAIQKKFRPLGYPVAMSIQDDDSDVALVNACWCVLKYAGLVVVDGLGTEQMLSLLTSRQDIYTDPQKPVQVESGLHVIGEPGPGAPVLVTTNFALSYYSVESEVISSRVPAYILSVDTEGTSVLTAWAADKFNETTIAAAIKSSGVESKVNHHKLVLPGHVAVLSSPLNDESGWDVLVGPKEASGIVSFLKNDWK